MITIGVPWGSMNVFFVLMLEVAGPGAFTGFNQLQLAAPHIEPLIGRLQVSRQPRGHRRQFLFEIGVGAAHSFAQGQGLTLVHFGAQLEQFQDSFMSEVGSHGGQKGSR